MSRNLKSSLPEQLKASSFDVYNILDGDDSASSSMSALEALNRAVDIISRMVELDPSLKPEMAMLEGLCRCRRSGAATRNYSENMEFDADRLAEIEERLELIRNLKGNTAKAFPIFCPISKKSKISWVSFPIQSNVSKL